jgi:cell division protein FtsQ
MGRKLGPEQEAKKRAWGRGLRYALYSALVLTLGVAALYAYSRTDQFLASDTRFLLAAPAADGGGNPAVQIQGVDHTSRDAILSAFTPDYGRSVYLLPLAERRRSLLAIDWVKDANVSRLWPDRVAVRIVERTPVAFIQIPAGGGSPSFEAALIDADGVILQQPSQARFTLPVLTGIRRQQSQAARRERVAVALRLLKEVGTFSNEISEIEVGDAENVNVVRQVEGRAVLLMLGNRNFLSRLQNFMGHYEEIHQRLPNAATFDLRLDDRITAVEGGVKGG